MLNKNHVNAEIQANILPDEKMRSIGFTDYNPERWCFNKDLKDDIFFSVTINKKNPLDLRIDIIDDDFMQPYDYQYILNRTPNHKVALRIKEFVEKYMKYLEESGVIVGHVEGEYI